MKIYNLSVPHFTDLLKTQDVKCTTQIILHSEINKK